MEMNEKNNELIEKAYKLGKKFEKECTGCAQSSIAAIFKALSIWNDDVFKAASGLADGLGLTGDGSCGALIGASMVIGYLFGRESKDFDKIGKPMKSYKLVKQLHGEYLEKYDSCRCHDVQMKLVGKTYDLWNPKELKESFSSGMIEHCSEVVGNIAKIGTKIILKNGFQPYINE